MFHDCAKSRARAVRLYVTDFWGTSVPERWVGIGVASETVTVIDAEVPDSGLLVIQADLSWDLQEGDRAPAYHVMHQQVANYVREHGIDRIVVKSSALSLSGTKKVHLEAAELRGVVVCRRRIGGTNAIDC